MLYPYKYLSNCKIVNLHKYIEHFFSQIINNDLDEFDEDILITEDFKPIYDKYKKSLFKNLTEIFDIYKALNPTERNKFKEAIENNNFIEELCNGKKNPIHYNDISDKIREKLKILFKEKLWEEGIGATKPRKLIKEKCGTVLDHYHEFVKEENQKVLICPFCGMEPMLSEYDPFRVDYDHYIPKGSYPFNSINLKNLVPMCHTCNSKFKLQKDTLFHDKKRKKRRKVFFPYDSKLAGNEVFVKIKSDEFELKKNDNWELEINDSQGNDEKIDSWKDIFSIRDRYKNKIKQTESTWKTRIFREYSKRKNRESFNFQEFKEYIIDEVFDIKDQVNGIVQKAYYEFFFSNCTEEVFEAVLL